MDPSIPITADAFRMSRDGPNVAIEFGGLDGVAVPAGLVSVFVSDRIVVPLETARRLLVGVEESLRPHAGRLRAEDAKALTPQGAANATRPGQGPQRPAQDPSGEKAAQLLRLVGGWGAPHQYERSLRLSEVGLQANRYLLTLNAKDIPGDPVAQTLAICDQFAMPPAMRETAAANFTMAKCVHFGFEGDPASIVCKLYLERGIAAEEARRARTDNRPVLMHLAFKWDLLRDAAVTTRYLWRPFLTAPEIEARLDQIYRDGAPGSRDVAKALLRQAIERAPPENLQFLEVEEAENARRSFDLNVYNAKLQVKDIHSLLQQMREHFGVRPGRFQALYDQIKGMSLGHLAGGVHRDGKDFFNLYYGAVGLPHNTD
jgi:tryptophan halogenase